MTSPQWVCSASRDDARPRQRRAAEGEEVLRDVVEEHAHVQRTVDGRAFEEQVREPVRLRDELAMGPHPVPEAQRGPVGDRGVGGVTAEQRGGVRRGHGRLARRGNGTPLQRALAAT
jgi:hypothetical protein